MCTFAYHLFHACRQPHALYNINIPWHRQPEMMIKLEPRNYSMKRHQHTWIHLPLAGLTHVNRRQYDMRRRHNIHIHIHYFHFTNNLQQKCVIIDLVFDEQSFIWLVLCSFCLSAATFETTLMMCLLWVLMHLSSFTMFKFLCFVFSFLVSFRFGSSSMRP